MIYLFYTHRLTIIYSSSKFCNFFKLFIYNFTDTDSIRLDTMGESKCMKPSLSISAVIGVLISYFLSPM